MGFYFDIKNEFIFGFDGKKIILDYEILLLGFFFSSNLWNFIGNREC